MSKWAPSRGRDSPYQSAWGSRQGSWLGNWSLGKWGLLSGSLFSEVTVQALRSVGVLLAENSWIGLLAWFPALMKLYDGLCGLVTLVRLPSQVELCTILSSWVGL